MKRFVIGLIPEEKPWSSSVDPRRVGAAMVLILGVTAGAKLLPGALSPTARLLGLASLELAGCLSALFLVLAPDSGGGRGGILGAARLKLGTFAGIAAAPPLIWLGCAGLGAAWGALLRMLAIPYDEFQPLIAEIRNFGSGDFLLVLLAVGVMTPAAEEFFFRRLLYGVLEPLGVWRAALASSALFAAAHGFLFGLPGLFWMGLVFQVVYCRCRNLGAPILVHAVVNCAALAGARAGWGMPS